MNNALAGAAGALIGILAGGYTVCKSGRAALAVQKRRAERAEAYFHTLNQWLMIKNRGINIEQFFIDNHYARVGIYGFAFLGQRLAEELSGSSYVETVYFIDKNESYVKGEKNVYAPTDDLPEVDVIVVTPVSSYGVIENMLKQIIDYPIVSIEDIVFDLV